MQTGAPLLTLTSNGGAPSAGVNSLADARLALPFPRLLNRLGVEAPDRDKFEIRCPIHGEQNGASFAVERKDNKKGVVWFWRCFGKCDRGGDEIKFLEAYENLSTNDAIARYKELARNGAAPRSSSIKTRSASARQFDWQECVDALTEKDVEQVAQWRGYSVELVRWLHENKFVGIYNRHIAFPVFENGQVVGVHYKVGKNWFYTPKGTKTRALVIGELIVGDPVHCFESQWDAFAYMDVSGERSGVVVTRGASNGAGILPKDAKVYLWTQNDEAGEKWQDKICANPSSEMRRVTIPSQHKDLNDWTKSGATVDDLVAAMCAAETLHAPAPERPLIEFRSPLQLKNFTPPPGHVLAGDCHIKKGDVFVEGGPPGVGKSRGLTALAVAGATGADWFGLKVHRKFKVLIVQTENGEFRLAREFAELDCEALEDYVRVCPPPPYGLCFGRDGFREQLGAAIADFKPDLVGFDPWNAAAREQDSKEYLDTFDALKSVLPLGDDAPALGLWRTLGSRKRTNARADAPC
jgi:hypothetical protein